MHRGLSMQPRTAVTARAERGVYMHFVDVQRISAPRRSRGTVACAREMYANSASSGAKGWNKFRLGGGRAARRTLATMNWAYALPPVSFTAPRGVEHVAEVMYASEALDLDCPCAACVSVGAWRTPADRAARA